MGLFESNDEEKPNNNISNLFALIGDKSVFGRYYTKICEIMKSRGVPTSRLPSKEHFMSRVFSCLDQAKMSEWIEQYSEMEGIADYIEE